MPPKEFNKVSNEHVEASKGMKFKTIKPHHEVLGDLKEGVVLELESIAHYPTRYRLLDQDGNCSIEDRCFGYLPVHRIGFVPHRNSLLLPNLVGMSNISQSSYYRYAYFRYVR